MYKHQLSYLSISAALVIGVSGCATSTGTIEYDTSKLVKQNSPSAQVSVFIKTITDERVFDEHTKDPSVPSVDGHSEYAKDHAIARKRNSYGKALGKIILPENQSVKGLSREAIESALHENGWKVVKDENDVTPETKLVNVKINKFWSWMNPGFWQITLTSNIEVTMDKAPKTGELLTVEGKYAEGFQVGSGENWRTVMQKAYETFVYNLKQALGKPD